MSRNALAAARRGLTIRIYAGFVMAQRTNTHHQRMSVPTRRWRILQYAPVQIVSSGRPIILLPADSTHSVGHPPRCSQFSNRRACIFDIRQVEDTRACAKYHGRRLCAIIPRTLHETTSESPGVILRFAAGRRASHRWDCLRPPSVVPHVCARLRLPQILRLQPL